MAGNRKSAHLLSWIRLGALCFAAVPTSVGAVPDQPWPTRLRAQMVRLNAVGYRLDLTAAPLCPKAAAGTGISLDYIEAYDAPDRPAIKQLLGMSDRPQIAAVAPRSPAALAGVRPGDDIVAVDGVPFDALRARARDAALLADELEEHFAATPAGKGIELTLDRQGEQTRIRVEPTPICSARFVIKTGNGFEGFTDGANVALSDKLIAFAQNDDELALVAGHELGHVVNRDGEARSISQRRTMEDRADAMGVRLAHCAGFDPVAGLSFWLRRDAQDWLRLLRDPTHRSRKARVALMRQEAGHLECPVHMLQGAPDESHPS